MKKLLILSALLVLITGCRTVYIQWPDGKKVFVGSLGLDAKIGSFSAKNETAEVTFSDLDQKVNTAALEKLIDKIPNASLLDSILH